MAKSDLSFERLNIGPAYSSPNKPQFREGMPIHALDTETADGKPFLLTASYDSGDIRSYHDFPSLLSPERLFEILTNRKFRSSVCVWYNLDYDANVILGALPERQIYEIAVTGATEWNEYNIVYIPSKALIIKDGNRNQYRHFDIAQFFFCSLGEAANEWLGEGKKDEGIDVEEFGRDPDGTVNQYILSNWDRIVEYGEYDSDLTRRLWKEFSGAAENLDIPTARPYSTGYLAEQTFNVIFHDTHKPGFSSRSMQRMAWKAYRGGRFEITERGLVGNVVIADINSAYPHILRSLPDPSTLEWRHVKRPDLSTLRGSDYGFVRALVRTDPARNIQPFGEKDQGLLYFPSREWSEIVVLLPQFLYGIDAGWIQQFEIIECHLGSEKSVTSYPFRWVEDLYQQRQKYKSQGNEAAQKALKIVLNSLYGKLAQITLKTVSHSGNEPFKEWWIPVSEQEFPKHIRDQLVMEGTEFHREAHAGRYWNPFLASHITGLTRLQLLRSIVESGLEDDCVMLATDSIMIRERAWNNCDFLDSFGGSELGGWEIEKSGEAFIVGCGIYELQPEDGDPILCNRGFNSGIGAWQVPVDSLREAAREAVWDEEKNQSIIPISNKRPLKIGQAVWQHATFSLSQVGQFLDFPKGIAAGMDRKRDWPQGSSVSFSDLLSGSETSQPRILTK